MSTVKKNPLDFSAERVLSDPDLLDLHNALNSRREYFRRVNPFLNRMSMVAILGGVLVIATYILYLSEIIEAAKNHLVLIGFLLVTISSFVRIFIEERGHKPVREAASRAVQVYNRLFTPDQVIKLVKLHGPAVDKALLAEESRWRA